MALSKLGDVFGQLCNALAAFFSPARPAMALSNLSEDELGVVFVQLCSMLEPRDALDLSSASRGLREQTHALRRQLRVEHDMLRFGAAATLFISLYEALVDAAPCIYRVTRGMRLLREAKEVSCNGRGLSTADMATLGTLGLVLSALQTLILVAEARPAPTAYSGWRRGWARARCRP